MKNIIGRIFIALQAISNINFVCHVDNVVVLVVTLM